MRASRRRFIANPNAGMIPRIIHQTWKTGDIPEHLREFQSSWLKHHPGWEYMFWSDADNERLIAEHYPEFIAHYRRASPAILKVDLVRMAYLHRFGGIYADLDFEALKPLDPLLTSGRIVIGRELNGIGRTMRGHDFVINALIASPSGHPLWLEVMRRMAAGYRPRRRFENHSIHVISMTIAMLDDAITAYQPQNDDITVLSHEAFYPAVPTERLVSNRRRLAAQLGSYAVHHYESSWISPWSKFIYAFIRLRQRWKSRRRQH